MLPILGFVMNICDSRYKPAWYLYTDNIIQSVKEKSNMLIKSKITEFT